MDINIRLTVDAPAGWRRRVLLYVAIPLGFLAVAAGIAYANLATFNEGDTLSAEKVNGNFSQVESDIKAVQNDLNAFKGRVEHDGGYSVGGLFCGVTGVTDGSLSGFSGSQVGYAKAKAVCAGSGGKIGTCGASAHMCTSEEMVRHAATGGALPNGSGKVWIAGGPYASVPGGTSLDCAGYVSANPSYAGAAWSWDNTRSQPGQPDVSSCDTSVQVACCQ